MPKISLLPDNSSVVDADIVPIVQNTDTTPVTKKVSAAEIKTYAQTGLTSSQVSDFTEAVQDVVGAFATPSTGIGITYNDGGGTLTFYVTGLLASNIGDFAEAVDDRVNALLVEGTGIDLTYNDGSNTLTIAVTTHTHTASDISDFSEAVDDRVNSLLVQGSNITLTYNDGSNTLTIDSTGGGGGSVDISDSAPGSPSLGDLWFESDTGRFSIYYDSSWIEVGSGSFVDKSGILTPPVGAPTYSLNYEFDQDSDLDDAVEITPTGTQDPVIGNGVLSVQFDDQDISDMAAVVWPHALAVGECVETAFSGFGITQNYTIMGVCVADGATASSEMITGLTYQYTNAIGSFGGTFNSVTNPQSGTSGDQTGVSSYLSSEPARVRVTRTATSDWLIEWSMDGVHWLEMYDYTFNRSLTPTHVGVCFSTVGGTNPIIGTFHYLRVYEV